ncbi:MAG TPA: GNAT family N-acetyltransferase [Anaerolineales bacterium]
MHINPMALSWQRFVVAVDEQGAIIGCGQVKPHGDGSRELASIAVVPERRGQGVARAIIEHLIEKEAGRRLAGPPGQDELNPKAGELYLTCRASLDRFYQRFGFRTLTMSEMPPYFRRLIRLARIFTGLGFTRDDLLVMKRTAASSRPN